MEKWKLFELDCNAYLNKKYGNFFTHFGFSNSMALAIQQLVTSNMKITKKCFI